MPLLFFISGTVSYYMLQRRSGWQFVMLRLRRLLVPVLFGMLVLVPPQVYVERLTQGYAGSFWQFYPSIFTSGPYPAGNLSWHHLWFIVYLFWYDVLFAPLFAWLAGPGSAALRARLGALARGHRVYWLALPSVAWYAATARALPQTNDLLHDGGYFVYWLLFVLVGFGCVAQPVLLASLERVRRTSLAIGLGLVLLSYASWHPAGLRPLPPVLTPLAAWSLVFACVGYGRRYLQRPHASLAYLNQAAYPFYVLHQTVIVVLAYYVVRAPHASIASKYLLLVGSALVVIMGLYHWLVRPVAWLRFLFGMKPAAAGASPVATAPPRTPALAA